MSAAQILSRAIAAHVVLWVDGERLRYKGPREAVDLLKPELAANKPEIIEYLRRAATDAVMLPRYPVADGPFTPYVVPMTPEHIAGLLTELRTTIGKLAEIEVWPDEHREHLLSLVARQPISTLTDDLAYFQGRLSTIKAVAHVVEISVQARRQ
ncbi:hypothetical protein AB9X41_21815 [Ralstonia solanacearum]|uniref:TubC N-terminal docking domain-related protein n=1 Tax=Ralstonia solanacearum TaxID=305 RepID=UPI00351794C9